jgi:bacillopeptidase F
LELRVPLEEGENSFTFALTDEAGNKGESITYRIVLDQTPPQIFIIDPKAGVETKDSVYRIRGRVEEGSTLTMDGRPISVNTDGTFSVQVDLEVGDNVFLLEAVDPVGHESDQQLSIVRVKKDEEGPAAGAVAVLLAMVAVAMATRAFARRRTS